MRAMRATNAGEGLKVEKKNTPLLWERIEHLTQSVESVLGEGSSRRISHTALDAVSHKLGRQDLLTARHSRAKLGNPAFLNSPKISNKLDPQTTSEDDASSMCLMFTDKFRVGLVNPTYKTLTFPHPLREGARGWGLISSRRERGLLDSRNKFPLSIFNFPFLQRENSRVRFNVPQPTTKEVFQC